MDPLLQGHALGDVLRELGRSYPDNVALVFGEVRLTFAELDDRVDRLASGLVRLGVKKGDRIAWLGQNSHRVVECLFASARIGGIFAPVNWRSSSDDLSTLLRDLEPQVVMWQLEEVGEAIASARSQYEGEAHWIQVDPSVDEYERLLGEAPDPGDVPVIDGMDPVLIIYTAGFNGLLNGSQLTHLGLLTQALVLANTMHANEETCCLTIAPMFHIAAWMYLLPSFIYGGRNVIAQRVRPQEVCEIIDRERVTFAQIAGATAFDLVEANEDCRYDLSSLEAWATTHDVPGWTDMTSPTLTPYSQWPGGFGQTEVGGIAAIGALLRRSGKSTWGRVAPILQLRVLDDNGTDLPNGEVGEAAVRGLSVHLGYWKRTEYNEQRLLPGGWWRTGDFVRRDADGVVNFIGPKARLIKSALENIYPAQVEPIIESHPEVSRAAIIGVPDERWTQAVKAIVVREPGSSLTAREIIEYVKERTASYRKPSFVEFVDELPLAGGRIDYDRLDATFGGGGYPGSDTRTG